MTTLSTESTNLLLATLRDKLLTGAVGLPLGQNAIFQVRAPDERPWPYAVMNLSTSNAGRLHGLRLDAQLEVLIFARPFAQLQLANDCADGMDRALTFYVMSTNGLIVCSGKTRNVLPVAGPPVDSETVTIRLVYTLVIWPRYLASLIIP